MIEFIVLTVWYGIMAVTCEEMNYAIEIQTQVFFGSSDPKMLTIVIQVTMPGFKHVSIDIFKHEKLDRFWRLKSR